jgi:lipid-A-disaccharide synthase
MSSASPLRLWISAGEMSGDLHGALLIQALRARSPGLRLMGMGGPAMRALNFESFFPAEALSVMGLTEVLVRLPGIFRLLRNIESRLKKERPDGLVVIDAPEFHFRVIRAARRLAIPVYYYISPKLWAWRPGRAGFIRAHVRRLISILPFEADFYRKFGMEVDYVGNPLLDSLDLPALDRIAPVPGRIGLLPGSRPKEVSALFPAFGRAAELLLRLRPDLEFHCVVAPGLSEDFLRSFWAGSAPLRFCPAEERYACVRGCEFLLAASGTAVLESALIGTPAVIAYRMSPLTFALARRLVKVPWVGLPNLIAGREILPELLQEEASGRCLAAVGASWLGLPADAVLDRESRELFRRKIAPKLSGECADLGGVRKNLAALRRIVGGAGATARAAGIILEDLGAD